VFEHASAEEQDSAVFAQVTFALAEASGDNWKRCNIEVFDGDSYLPAFVASGSIYIQAPLGYVLETDVPRVSDKQRYMEVRISSKRGPAFSLARVWNTVLRKRMA
jgi:hypothetical protein